MQQQEHIGLLVGGARRSIKLAVQRQVKPYRLTPPQFWMLIAAAENEQLRLGEHARRVRIDAPTASRLAFTLVKRGYFESIPSPEDRRCVSMRLTPKGRELVTKLLPVAAEIRASVKRGMTARELEYLRKGLKQVIENMENLETARPGARPAASAGASAGASAAGRLGGAPAGKREKVRRPAA